MDYPDEMINKEETLFPMKQFLESKFVDFHILNYIPMNEFFYYFTEFCNKAGYFPYKRKYGSIWKRYNISCATKKLAWKGKYVKTKYLFGISIDMID